MTSRLLLALLTIICLSFQTRQTVSYYTLIKKTKTIPGEVNQRDISGLSEPLKAIAAYYSAMEGSNCNKGNCELTTALGLGIQGSKEHVNALKKWFANDEAAQALIKQQCYLPPNSSSSFSDYVYLMLEQKGNLVVAKYKVFFYDHGRESFITSNNDTLLIGHQNIVVKRRKIWKGI